MENTHDLPPFPTCNMYLSFLEQKRYEKPNATPRLKSDAGIPQEEAVSNGIHTEYGAAIFTFTMDTRYLVEGIRKPQANILI